MWVTSLRVDEIATVLQKNDNRELCYCPSRHDRVRSRTQPDYRFELLFIYETPNVLSYNF